jgi:Putative transposase/Transposase zinc-binding domain
VATRVVPSGHPELADIFRAYGGRLDHLSAQQRRVIAAITSCRTAALGGHVRECDRGCGYREISYNSCRDRHCPKCQGLARVRWQEARAADLLPVPYFHLVFTVPDRLHDIFLAHPRVAYGLLFDAVDATLREVAANPNNLGARIGMTAVLHTWTQTLLYHPHLHCIVPGGGLDTSGQRWIPSRENFFLAVRILSTVFRAKLLAALQHAVASGKLPADVRGTPVAKLLRHAARHKWVVYCKRPFAGPQQVLAYLGRYTHRIAITNHRIVVMNGDQVTFLYKDRADGDRRKRMSLPAEAFLRRFLLHVLPPGFVRIRHYGLLANPVRHERIALCRQLLNVAPETIPSLPPENWEQTLLRLTGKDLTRCPQCGAGRLCTSADIPPNALPRRPEERAASP